MIEMAGTSKARACMEQGKESSDARDIVVDPDAYGFIYRATNRTNGKVYIGQASSQAALSDFMSYLRTRYSRGGHNPHLNSALKKRGFDGFRWEVIAVCYDKEELDACEIRLIEEHGSFDDPGRGYNQVEGGQGGGRRSRATRQRMSQGRMGMKFADEHRKNISQSHKGVPLKEGHRTSIQKAQKVAMNRPETKARCRAAKLGVKFSEEHCRNISRVRMGKKFSDTHRENIAKNVRGRRWFYDPETGESHQVRDEEALRNGWVLGRTPKPKIIGHRRPKLIEGTHGSVGSCFPVICRDVDDTVIAVFRSFSELSEMIKLSAYQLRKHAREGTIVGGCRIVKLDRHTRDQFDVLLQKHNLAGLLEEE